MRFLAGCWFTAHISLAATVQGVAVDANSGKLLAFTKVTLAAVNASDSFTVQTDRAGRFSFPGVPQGSYLLKGERPGFVRARHGSRIAVTADAYFTAELRLRRAAAIQGTVFDENQVGLAGHTVAAYHATRPIRPAGSAVTDDRGFYRIVGLAPGKYFVRTAARNYPDGESLLPTFFGQGTALAQASQLDLTTNSEAGDINIQPVYGKLCRLTGWSTAGGAVVAKLVGDTGFVLEASSAAGQFAFDQLTPGSYQLFLESGPLSAHRSISLGGDLDGVAVELAPSLPAKFIFAEVGGNALDTAQITILAKRKDPAEGETRRAWPDAAALPAGTWELTVICGAGHYTASIQGGGEGERAWNEILVRSGRETLVTVTLSSRPGSVRGIVKAGGAAMPGVSVLLDSAVGAAHPIVVQKTIADERGEFRFRGLAPGRYRIGAANDPEQMDVSSLESLDIVVVNVEEMVETIKDLETP